MMKLQKYGFLALLMMAMLVAGCRSSRKAAKEAEGTDVTTSVDGVTTTVPEVTTSKASKQSTTAVTKVAENRQGVRGIRSKLNVALLSGSQMSAGGTLKMKRDEIIQISLSAVLGMVEVGRLEMTPEYLLIQDRINHQYMKALWHGIPHLGAAGINFYTFQSLFWDELFVPGKMAPDASDFETKKQGDDYVMTLAGSADSDAMLKFLVEVATGLVRQTSVSSTNVNAAVALDWTYSSWTTLGGKPFPTQMQMDLNSSNGLTSARFTLSRPQVDETMGDIRTTIDTNRYEQVNIYRLINRLFK